MTTWGYVYCALLGACNLLIFRVCLTLGIKQSLIQSIRNQTIRIAVFSGLVFTLVGGIAHRAVGFNPNVSDPWAWVIVFGIPFVLALLSGPITEARKADPGSSNLQRGKSLWQCLPLRLSMGVINPAGSSYQSHPTVSAAKNLIREAIDHAPMSNVDPARALANAAIAWQELGLLHRAINDFDEARHCFDKSLSVLDGITGDELRNPRVLGAKRETLFRLAELNHVLGNLDAARQGYQASLEIDAALGHDDSVGENTTIGLLSRL